MQTRLDHRQSHHQTDQRQYFPEHLYPTNEYLATSHVGQVGIFLWANRVHFGQALPDKIALRPTEMDIPMPITKKEQKGALEAVEGDATEVRLLDTADADNGSESEAEVGVESRNDVSRLLCTPPVFVLRHSALY